MPAAPLIARLRDCRVNPWAQATWGTICRHDCCNSCYPGSTRGKHRRLIANLTWHKAGFWQSAGNGFLHPSCQPQPFARSGLGQRATTRHGGVSSVSTSTGLLRRRHWKCFTGNRVLKRSRRPLRLACTAGTSLASVGRPARAMVARILLGELANAFGWRGNPAQGRRPERPTPAWATVVRYFARSIKRIPVFRGHGMRLGIPTTRALCGDRHHRCKVLREDVGDRRSGHAHGGRVLSASATSSTLQLQRPA